MALIWFEGSIEGNNIKRGFVYFVLKDAINENIKKTGVIKKKIPVFIIHF